MEHSQDQANCPMIMVFHGGHCERILWSSWVASTLPQFIFSALAFFVLAFFYEGLKFTREHLKRHAISKEAARIALELQAKTPSCHATTSTDVRTCSNLNLADINDKSFLKRITSAPHLIQTAIHFLQIVISYLLMLVFMSFNYWLCLSVVLGLGIGYFFFGWIRLESYEHDCCP